MGQLRLIMDYLEVCRDTVTEHNNFNSINLAAKDREFLLEVTFFKESEDHSTSSGEHNSMLACKKNAN